MSVIIRMWAQGEIPNWDAVYYADGHAFELDEDPSAPAGLRIAEEFDAEEELREEPEATTWFGTFQTVDLDAGQGYLCCGECTYHGSAGWFARLDAARQLVWVVHLTLSNPFNEIAVGGGQATFRSTNGVTITVDIREPEFRFVGS
ncbi:hypothetical protein [Micromonospora rubida]|uniref:hypothetical protein n=1 Tax=Micromonospora rubida TaxID=2697657 RepID=UPI001377EF41|nr:hypothetical protein [Micromonospora rubida]NBE79928.1 hypothetical protein [Micromonospora rubida]